MTMHHDESVNRWVPAFAGFTEFTASIPKLYWGVKSQEQRILTLCKQLHKLVCYADMLGGKITMNRDDIDELTEMFNKFMESGFDDYYAEQIEAWINANMERIISASIKQVYFGLNDEGYFVAYVPDSWSDITFDTGAVYGRTDYGRLILRFEADGAIDNTYSYSASELTKEQQFVSDFEAMIKRVDATFDTLFTNLDEEVVLNGNI